MCVYACFSLGMLNCISRMHSLADLPGPMVLILSREEVSGATVRTDLVDLAELSKVSLDRRAGWMAPNLHISAL
jgi:hypothetical protein